MSEGSECGGDCCRRYLGLGGGTDTGHGKTDAEVGFSVRWKEMDFKTSVKPCSLDGGTDTLEEEFGFQEDLAVGDGNDVGGLKNGRRMPGEQAHM